MAAKHWMAAAFANAHGQLRKKLGAKKGETIPRSKLKAAARAGGKEGKQAQLAMNANPLR
jgi:hypothetical protein